MTASGSRIVAVDTSVLINFLHLSRLDLLGSRERFQFVVPQEVVAEVQHPDQQELLQRSIGSRELGAVEIRDLATLGINSDLRQVMGSGEAACLALAKANGWLIACDERRVFLRHATNLLGSGHILTTPGLLLLCIRDSLLSIEEADAAKALLEQRRFRMSFGSFRELV